MACWRPSRKAGEASARAASCKVLAKDNVSAYIEERLEEMKMSADEALLLMGDIARGDIAQVMDVSSMVFMLDMKRAKELGLTKLIKRVKQKTITKIGKNEDNEDVEIHNLEIELYPADAALDKILRVHGKYDDRLNIKGNVTIGVVGLGIDTDKV